VIDETERSFRVEGIFEIDLTRNGGSGGERFDAPSLPHQIPVAGQAV
jgi:hypothetical protein